MENWKPASSFPRYEVSDLGSVRDITTKTPCSQFPNGKGYIYVSLWMSPGKRKMMFVHRIVAAEFCDNLLNKPFVNHIDGQKANNVASNLEWVTCRENILHKHYALGGATPSRSGGRNAMYPQETIDRAKHMRNEGSTLKEIALTLGFNSTGHLSKILRGQYQHVTRTF